VPDATETCGHPIVAASEIEFVDPLGRDEQRGPQFGVGASRSITLWPVGSNRGSSAQKRWGIVCMVRNRPFMGLPKGMGVPVRTRPLNA
jgi:hypothetical protein